MKRKIPLIALCLLFLGMAGYFGSQFLLEWREYRAGEQAYRELSQYVHLETQPTAEPTAPEEELPAATETQPEETQPLPVPDDRVWPVVDFEALRQINPDVVAWIYIEGTNINYPVVQGEDNSHYLNRLINGNRNAAGSIFLDYRNDPGLSGKNNVLYGHNMKNGTMFQQITQYQDQSFYDAHPVCLIMTPEGNYTLEFFAGYITDMNSQAWKLEFGSEEEFALWLKDTISNSTFTGTAQPEAQDRVVTLSTCTYEYDDARFVLVGILKPQTIL